MTQPLDDFISSLRLADSIEQERFLIATELAHIRAYLRKCEQINRPRVVCKLIFLDIIGKNVAWGQLDTITLMSEEQFSYKRLGYIGASVLLDETADLKVLAIHTLLKDLGNNDPNIQCLALSFIANNGTAEVCREVAGAVQKLDSSKHTSVLKRVGMALVRIVRTNPDFAEQHKNTVQKFLNSNNHGVALAGINLVLTLINLEPRLAKLWGQFSRPFTRILKSLVSSHGSAEFVHGVFNDPYMQIKVMQTLTLLKKPSEELDAILQSIVSTIDCRRNTGRALLYAAVELVVAVSDNPALRGLAFNQVGRLLSLKEPNILYSSLSVFARVLYTERDVINRNSLDSQALQRYKKQIVRCLNHRDPSVRRRALDVVSALIDESNVQTLVPEIITYIKLADNDFRYELVSKIYHAINRFAPDKRWNFDMVHQVIVDSGNYVSNEIITDFCDLISNTPEIQEHAVDILSSSLLQFVDNQTLMQISAYIIGEFSVQDNGSIGNFAQVLILPQTKSETKFYIITAVCKLGVRFRKRKDVCDILNGLVTSSDLEIQQRAGEMWNIMQMDNLCEEFLAPIPVKAERKKKTVIDMKPNNAEDQKKDVYDSLLMNIISDKPAQTSSPKVQGTGDLLSDFLGLSTPAVQSSGQNSANNAPSPQNQGSKSLLDDLLNGLSSAPSQQSQSSNNFSSPMPLSDSRKSSAADFLSDSAVKVAQSAPVTNPSVPMNITPTTDYGNSMGSVGDITFYGHTKINPDNQSQMAVKVTAVTTGSTMYSNFKMKFSVCAGWRLMVKPPNQEFLAQNQPVSQILYIQNENRTNFNMNIAFSYLYGSQPVTETISVVDLP